MNLSNGIIQDTQKSDWESESILQMEDRFRSGGIGKSEIF